MNELTSKRIGGLMLVVGFAGILTLLSLVLFFVGLFQNIQFLTSMGRLNDMLNILTGVLSAILASALYLALRWATHSSSLSLVIGAWIGAIMIAYGSWLILTDKADVELSSYYFFFGNGLIGIWLWMLNRAVRQQAQADWPRNLTRLGLLASILMMVGLPSIYGIVLGLDGDDYSPLIMISGISFLGTGIFYPLWCLRLGRWILAKQNERVTAAFKRERSAQ